MAKFILGSKFTLSRSLKSHLAETCLTLEDVTIHVTCIFQMRIQDFVKGGGASEAEIYRNSEFIERRKSPKLQSHSFNILIPMIFIQLAFSGLCYAFSVG